MGKRDYRHRETKKAKKDPKKIPQVTILPTPTNVEMVKKKRKGKEVEEETEEEE